MKTTYGRLVDEIVVTRTEARLSTCITFEAMSATSMQFGETKVAIAIAPEAY